MQLKTVAKYKKKGYYMSKKGMDYLMKQIKLTLEKEGLL